MDNRLVITYLTLVVALVTGTNVQDVARSNHARIISAPLPRINMALFDEANGDAADTCKPDETTCENDMLTFCGFNNKKFTIPCSKFFDGRSGYCDCDKVQCVPKQPSCQRPQSTQCSTPDEKLPDFRNCHRFTYCDGQNRFSLECAPGFIYNPRTKSCGRRHPCHNLSCNPRKFVEWKPFPQAPEYFVFCMSGQGEVRQCSQTGYAMQGNRCQFECREEGGFKDPNPDACRKGVWHACSKTRLNAYVKDTQQCPVIQGVQLMYDEKKEFCTKEDTCGGGSGGNGGGDTGGSGGGGSGGNGGGDTGGSGGGGSGGNGGGDTGGSGGGGSGGSGGGGSGGSGGGGSGGNSGGDTGGSGGGGTGGNGGNGTGGSGGGASGGTGGGTGAGGRN